MKRTTIWVLILILFGILLFGCEPDQYEQIVPNVDTRDTGVISVPNPIDYPWVLTHEVVREIKGTDTTYLLPDCIDGKRIYEKVTAPILSYYKFARAGQTFKSCN